jgi:single-stranded DNA-binding protein
MRSPYCSLKISGRLMKDPVLITTKSNKIMCAFSIVYNPLKNRGIIFHFITFKELAEFVYLNYKKGDFIVIKKAGGVESNDYKDNTGKTVKIDRWKCWEIHDGTEHIKLQTFEEDDEPLY